MFNVKAKSSEQASRERGVKVRQTLHNDRKLREG